MKEPRIRKSSDLGGKIRRNSPRVINCATGLLALLFTASSAAAVPLLRALEPVGAQRGTTLVLKLAGEDLALGSELITPLPGAIARLTPSETGGRGTELPFLVQLRTDALPGVYPIQVRSAAGLSNVLLFSVGAFPEVKEKTDLAEDRGSAVQRIKPPVIVNGTLIGEEEDIFSFSVTPDQTLVFEVEARRSGSGIDPVIRVLDPSGREIAANDDAPGIGEDCRVQVRFTKPGEFRVAVHDSHFSRQKRNFYRLKVGYFLYAEGMFPLGWQRGKEVEITLSGGNLPGAVKVSPSWDLPASERVTWVSLPEARMPQGSFPLPFLVGDLPEIIEPASEHPLGLPADTVVNGRISKPGERDLYRLSVKSGEKWLFELDAAGLGTSRMQAYLEIYDGRRYAAVAGGQETAEPLASAVDASGLAKNSSTIPQQKGPDPKLIFEVPEKIEELILAVEDLNFGGGPGWAYRLRATRQWEDFQLEIGLPYLNVPAGGSATLAVRIERIGYQGPIQLSIPGASEVLLAEGGHVPARARNGYLTLTAKRGAKLDLLDLEVWGEGTAADGKSIRRRASGLGLTGPRTLSGKWLTVGIPVAISASEPLHFEIPDRTIRVVQGLKRDVKASVRARLEHPSSLSAAARVPIGTSLNVDSVTVIPAGEGRWDVTVSVQTYFDTPLVRFDLVLDTVVEAGGRGLTVTSPVITVDVVTGYALQVDPALLRARNNSIVELSGKVIRDPLFHGGILIEVEDLPRSVTCPVVHVPATASDFRLVFRVGPDGEPGDYDIRLVSMGTAEGRKDKKVCSIPDVGLRLKLDREAKSSPEAAPEGPKETIGTVL